MLNLILADDHAVLRQALSETLSNQGDCKVLAEASNGEELLNLLKTHKPDLIILDISMPKFDGLRALEELSKSPSSPPVLVLSANEGERYVRAALKAGAKGYVPKNAAMSELKFAISSIIGGKTYLSPTITSPLMGGTEPDVSLNDPFSVLTTREVEIVKHLADGKPNRDIAKLLHISTRTVDTHRSNILRKMKLKTNAELVKVAIANGLIEV